MWMLLLATVAVGGPRMIPAQAMPSQATVGQPAPGFLFAQPDGALLDLALGDGQPLVVAFWASWCRACEPALRALADLHQRDLPVLAVNVDRDSAAGQAWLQATGLSLPVVWDPGADVLGRYAATTLPALYLVDDAGLVVGHADHPDALPTLARGEP